MAGAAGHDMSHPHVEDTPAILVEGSASARGDARPSDALVVDPFVNRVVADFLPKLNKTVLTDILVGEVHELRGVWALEFDEDGDGCVAEEGGDTTRFLDDIFCARVSRDADGQIFVKRENEDLQNLTMEMRRYEETSVSIAEGGGRSSTSRLTCYVLARARCGFRTWWCLTSLYRSIELTSFKGYPSKWVYEGLKPWCEGLAQVGMPDHLMQATGGLTLEESLRSTDRFLATSSISSPGLVWLLVRLSSMSNNCGGLRGQDDRRRASELLNRILRACFASERSCVRIELSNDWSCLWPRPVGSGEIDLELVVSPRLEVDLEPWRDLLDAAEFPRGHPCRLWWRELFGGSDPPGDLVNLESLLVLAMRSKALVSLLSQVLWCIGSLFEEVVVGIRDCGGLVEQSNASIDSLKGNPKEVDLQLCRYMESCKLAVGYPLHMSLATDKASIKGCSLVNTVAVTGGNLAALLPPQASLPSDVCVFQSPSGSGGVLAPGVRL